MHIEIGIIIKVRLSKKLKESKIKISDVKSTIKDLFRKFV